MSLDAAWRRQITGLIAAVQESNIATLDLEHGPFAIHIERDIQEPDLDLESLIAAIPDVTKPPSLPILRSPQVGTFYVSAEPNGDPFLKEGDQVEQGQVIGLIEAMKLISEVEAEESGYVRRVLIVDGQPVEYGQPLFELE